jgi:hypothetical protein
MVRRSTFSRQPYLIRSIQAILSQNNKTVSVLFAWIAVAFISRYLSDSDEWLMLCLGVLQWFAIAGYLHGLKLWAIASILGWGADFGIRQTLSFSTEQILGDTPNWLPFWLTYGSWTPDGGEFYSQMLWDNALSDGLQWTLIGLFQWLLVLYKPYKGSVWWILASGVGGCLQGILSTLMGFAWGSTIALGGGSLGYSAVTGMVLIYLKNKHYKVIRPKGRWIIEHKQQRNRLMDG